MGQSAAASLVSEHNDITVIDTDAARLRELESRLDLRGVVGSGMDPKVLAEAGARDTDLLIACAAQDETNLVCCKVAQMLFNVPTRMARVRTSGFEDGSALLARGLCGRPHPVPRGLAGALHRQAGGIPGALQVREFRRRACLPGVGARARAGAPAWGWRSGICARNARGGRCASWPSTGAFPTGRPLRALRRRHAHRAGRRGVRAGGDAAHSPGAGRAAPA